MNTQDAARRLADLLNEIGAAGVVVEAAIGGLSLGMVGECYSASVDPVDPETGVVSAGSTVWRAS